MCRALFLKGRKRQESQFPGLENESFPDMRFGKTFNRLSWRWLLRTRCRKSPLDTTQREREWSSSPGGEYLGGVCNAIVGDVPLDDAGRNAGQPRSS
jgi:hypothetical protein